MTWLYLTLLVAFASFQGSFAPAPYVPLQGRAFTTVTVQNFKTDQNNNQGGFPATYLIDGLETPVITLVAVTNRQYFFNVLNVECDHPVYIATDRNGQNVSRFEENIAYFPPSTPIKGCESIIRWAPDLTQLSNKLPPGVDYYYQCTDHLNMGWVINVIAPDLCDGRLDTVNTAFNDIEVFTTELFEYLTNATLNTSPLADSWGSFIGQNLSNPTVEASRVSHAKMFYTMWGCADGSSSDYTGNLQSVHSGLTISEEAFEQFVNLTILAARNFDAPVGFPMKETDIPIFERRLRAYKPDICPGTCVNVSICDRNAAEDSLSTDAWVDAILSTFQESWFFNNESALSPFYTPAKQNSVNLDNGYTDFFKFLFDCDGNTPFNNNTLISIHSSLSIGVLEWESWVIGLLRALDENDVPLIDQERVNAALQPYQSIICNSGVCASPGEVIDIVMTVVPKTNESTYSPIDQGSPYFGIGFADTYLVDEVQSKTLQLQVGKAYRFINRDQSILQGQGCQHPLCISDTSITGAGGLGCENVTGVTYPAGGLDVCEGRSLVFTPEESQVGVDLFYVCDVHPQMGGRIFVYAANDTVPSVPPDQTSTTTTTANDATTLPSVGDSSSDDELSLVLIIIVSVIWYIVLVACVVVIVWTAIKRRKHKQAQATNVEMN